MNSFDMNDDIRFLLPDDYIHETGVNDDGVLMTAIRADETTDDEGNVSYGFDARARLFEHDPDDFEKGFSSDRLLDVSMENLETARYITISHNPAANLINKKLSFSVFGIELHFNSIMCVIHADEWDVISLTVSKKNTGDPDELIRAVERLIEVAKAIRIKGKPIPFESFDVASAVDALDYDDDLIDGIEDVTSEVIREARSTSSVKSFKAAKPNDSLYPHYKQLKGKTGPIAPGITMITNATGTEYEFIPLSRAIDNDELPEEERAAYQSVIEKDTAAYDLADRVPEMQRLFHVNASVFNEKRDRECEIDQGLLHRAYMMSALRSFAWTLADFCETNSTEPGQVPVHTLKEIVAFCAKKEWLNYKGDSNCSGLCGCSDLHVFYIPDGVSKADRKKLLPSDELIKETERRKAALPYYNPILDEVHSLDALRKDLAYLYPAVHALCESLAENRDYNEALTGNEADIVYAWCSLAKAAKEPFYVEDGPMRCYFTQIENKEEIAARLEAQRIQWAAEREANAERNREEWLKDYGHAVEKNPEIQFDGKRFVFSGVDSDEIINAVLKRGGQKRSSVSGITDYLVVDPRYCGESNTDNAIEQQKKGKPVKIILLDDLKAILDGKTPTIKQPVSKSLSQTKATTAPATYAPRRTTPAGFPKGTRAYPGDDLEVFAGTVTEYNGTERDIILPAGITEIGAEVFQFTSLRSIVIPEGVTEIGKDAFYNCEELTHVALPNSLKEIGEQAFHGCSKLQSIDFPDGLSEIGETAFYKSGLTEVHIPESCTIIRESAFQKCSELKKVLIHDDVEEIEPFAFSDCPKLREIYVPLGTKIGSLAFDKGCTIQTSKNASVNVLTAVKSLPAGFPKGKRVYAGDDLEIVNGIVTGYTGDETDIILPAGITAIGEDAFQFTSLQSVVIPEGVTEIGKDAFYNCDELTHIYLPNSLKKLGESVFYGCKELKKVDLPDGLTDIGDSAFRESGLVEVRIPSSCTVIKGWTFNECSDLSRVILHDSIKRIGEFAFESCPELTGIVVPQKTIIEKYAFDDEAYVEREKNASNRKTSEANNTYAKVPTASEFSVTRTGILNKYTGKNRSQIDLPEGIKRIGASVFAYHFELESVIIPEGVTRIDKEAFVGSSLKTVSFPNTLQSIGEKAFWGTNLESISLPESLQTIEGYAFSNCRELRQVTFKGNSCTTLGWSVFSDCSALRDIYLPEGITKIGYAVLNKSGIVSASVPSTVKVLESRMFDECEKLKEVIFRGKVESIGYRMFGKCKALEMIVIPEGTKSIQKNAFLESKQLKDVFIPLSVESIALDDNDAGKRTVFHVVKGSNAEKFCIEHQRKYDNLSYEEVMEKRKTEQIYADAKGLMEKGEFAAAKEKYAMIPDYKDAAKQAKICESKAEEQRIERLYTEAKQLMEAENYVAAKDRFLEITEYQDSEPLAKQCEEKEQIRRSELAYQQLIGKKQTAKTVGDWTALGNWFKQMNDYKDSQIQAKLCADKATELQRQIDEERQKELARRAKEERRKALEAEMKEQEAIIQQNKGLGALFGEKAKKRKTAQQRIEEIARELEKL